MNKNTLNIDRSIVCDDFQEKVSEVLLRHKSILDILSKLQQYNGKISRAVVKSVTSCGCISIDASKQQYDKETLDELKNSLKSHVNGELCEICREKIEEEIGGYIFYLAALCNTFDINLNDVILKECRNLETLGIYNLK